MDNDIPHSSDLMPWDLFFCGLSERFSKAIHQFSDLKDAKSNRLLKSCIFDKDLPAVPKALDIALDIIAIVRYML